MVVVGVVAVVAFGWSSYFDHPFAFGLVVIASIVVGSGYFVVVDFVAVVVG